MELFGAGHWAEFGLLGLVVGALIAIIVIFIRTLKQELKESRQERKESTRMHYDTSIKLATALDRLTSEISKNHEHGRVKQQQDSPSEQGALWGGGIRSDAKGG